MANIQIPNLPAVAALSGEELFEGVQAGTSVKISLGQVIAATRTGTPTTIPLPVSAGGTGASTAPNARTNLGLGTMSTQDASAVAITGGSINGTTIGASTPAAISGTTGDFFGNLTIENASPSLTFAETGDTADRDARIRLNDADLIFETVTDAGVQVRENMRITYNGNIGINNSLPSVALDVTGDGSFTGDLFISDKIVHSGDTNTSIRFPAVDTVTVETAGTERMRIRSDGNVLIDTDTLYVDAVNNRVGVNKIPSDELDVNGVVACTGGFIDTGTDSTATQAILSGFRSGTGSQTGGAVRIRSVGDGSGDAVEMIFDTDTTERMRINSSGVTVSGVSPAIIFAETDTTDEDARVRLNLGDLLFETITDAGAQVRENMRIGSNGRVGIGQSSPANALDVIGVVSATGGFIDTGTDSTSTQVILSGFRSGDGSETGGAVRIRSVGDGSGDAVEMIFDTDTTERMRINSSGVTVSGVSPAIIFAETDTTDEDARVRVNLGDLIFETITDAGALVQENMRIGSNGRVGLGQSSPANALDVTGVVSATGGFIDTGTDSTATQVILSGFRSGDGSETGGAVRIRSVGDGTGDAVEMIFDTNSTEAMRINASGTLLIGKTAQDVTAAGVELYQSGVIYNTVSANTCQIVNRLTDDGTLVSFRQASTSEGSISVSGSTVSFNGGHLARWAQLPDNSRPDLLKGTVMSNLDQMSYWNGEENEQLNCVQVSNVNGDVNVAGVFVAWDSEDDGYNDILLGMTGDMVIRIAAGTTVQRGDLLMSAGDGTARPQGEDIVRSSTVAKVTSTHVSETYADGSYVVPCVLMAC
jgi:hypothetical protein